MILYNKRDTKHTVVVHEGLDCDIVVYYTRHCLNGGRPLSFVKNYDEAVTFVKMLSTINKVIEYDDTIWKLLCGLDD